MGVLGPSKRPKFSKARYARARYAGALRAGSSHLRQPFQCGVRGSGIKQVIKSSGGRPADKSLSARIKLCSEAIKLCLLAIKVGPAGPNKTLYDLLRFEIKR